MHGETIKINNKKCLLYILACTKLRKDERTLTPLLSWGSTTLWRWTLT